MAQMDIPMAKVMSGMTMQVRVSGMKLYRVRFWLGCQCLKLATLIMGCGIEVSLDD